MKLLTFLSRFSQRNITRTILYVFKVRGGYLDETDLSKDTNPNGISNEEELVITNIEKYKKFVNNQPELAYQDLIEDKMIRSQIPDPRVNSESISKRYAQCCIEKR